LHHFASSLVSLPNDTLLPIAQHAADCIAPKVTSFEEEDALIRD
jgi:hypothetical protein